MLAGCVPVVMNVTAMPEVVGDAGVLIESQEPDAVADGAGETATTVVGAAIGNAVFDATGARLRQMPFRAERVKAALQARP